ncbi:CHAT domain-containing protein [Novosphingobium sp. Gsoil 351]|uniref:CHAT domain-containing protein n=1 Tax=Novosphingobium sp. Gsoil 351 TaxID=2675225 RepID=UPI0012B4E447|nr:CHAT domain-containing protein [Novosphingobium sp. Gsoil 351]QGN53487.1 CHAT domain-containing protein [Novosphingobium sp. Gsoil 351]
MRITFGANKCALVLAGLAVIAQAPSAQAQSATLPLSVRDSFPLGNGGNALCQVQSRSADAAIQGPFDRAWAIVCRDSALPVGYVFALRRDGSDPAVRLAQRRAKDVDCAAAAAPATSTVVAGTNEQRCKWRDPALDYSVVSTERGRVAWFAEGFTAYSSALDLALRSLIADRAVPGEVSVATTSIGDSEAYARIQAMTLDASTALAEGYRRNNSGDYADAAAYFETLDQRQAGQPGVVGDRVEFLVNAALQRSNLGQFGEADRLFAEADAQPPGSAVVERLRRNYEAIHRINQADYAGAVARLGQPLRMQSALGVDMLRKRLELTPQLAGRVNAADPKNRALGITDELKLSDEERAAILDAQAQALKGTALRLTGDQAAARGELAQALDRAVAVRNGRVVSIVRLRAQILSELAKIDEARGDFSSAESLLRSANDIVAVQYPETRSYAVSEAELAAFLVRRGREEEALKLYRDVVDRSAERRDPLSGLSRQMAPYFDLLVARMDRDPTASAAFFTASQTLVRPGVAETQAVLARELSGGDDEAARMFRQSVSLTRSIERARMQYAALSRLDDAAARGDEIGAVEALIKDLEAQERTTIVGLNAYPRYRAVAARALGEDELKTRLKPGETYAKIAVLGQNVYVYTADSNGARAYRAGLTANELERSVNALRNSISRFDGENYVTEPFNVELARAIYQSLFAPAGERMLAAKHLIFEPDGAMLKLPINLLVTDDASVVRYKASAAKADADPYDVTMVDWLGKSRLVSTAVSARAFMDGRDLPGSKAPEAYLGLGQNARVSTAQAQISGIRSATIGADQGCTWPLEVWNNPISDAELIEARSLVGAQQSDLMTGAAFSDTAVKSRGDLDRFRILHFATHGLVTPPEAGCPVRPALLTSFGPVGQSDGLLTFGEIFELKLDADMVILSACDTAGEADIQSTREAGVATGGGTSLDGLVRAFIGAGGRAVLASHWPAPDDYNATARLITGLFSAGAGVSTGEALLAAERKLMADPLTSHPYYWAGFAVVGDATRPLVTGVRQATAEPVGAATVIAGSR